jgi:hypothetical protein
VTATMTPIRSTRSEALRAWTREKVRVQVAAVAAASTARRARRSPERRARGGAGGTRRGEACRGSVRSANVIPTSLGSGNMGPIVRGASDEALSRS